MSIRTAYIAMITVLCSVIMGCGGSSNNLPPQPTQGAGYIRGGYAVSVPSNQWTNGIAVDKDGNVYVCASLSSSIFQVAPNGSVQTTYVHDFPFAGGFTSVCLDNSGNVYGANPDGGIAKFSPNGTFQGIITANLPPGALTGLEAVVRDKDGNSYVGGQDNTVVKLSPTGQILLNITLVEATPTMGANYVTSIAVNQIGDIYLCNKGYIQEYDPTGHLITQFASRTGMYGQPSNYLYLALDAAGNVYATDYANSELVKYTANGNSFLRIDYTAFGCGGVAVAPNGVVYVNNISDSEINTYTPK